MGPHTDVEHDFQGDAAGKVTPEAPNVLPQGRSGVVACLEFLLPDAVGIHDPAASETLFQWQQNMARRLQQFHGQLDPVQPNVWWMFFPDVDTTLALRRCLKAVWPVMSKPLALAGQQVYPRLGLAAGEHGDPHPPRMKALASQCVLPADMADLLPHGVPKLAYPSGEGMDNDLHHWVVIPFSPATLPVPKKAVAPPENTSEAPASASASVEETPEPMAINETLSPPEQPVQPDVQPVEPEPVSATPATPVSFAPLPHTPIPVMPASGDAATVSVTGADAGPDAFDAEVTPRLLPEDAFKGALSPREPVREPGVPLEQDPAAQRFDVAVRHYHAPAVEVQDVSDEAVQEDALQSTAPDNTLGLTLPASEPTIPEVVSQRYSVSLPQEPASGGLPVFAGLTERATALPSHLTSQALGAASGGSGGPVPFARTASQMGVAVTLPQWFALQQGETSPLTHTYSQVFPALVQAVKEGLGVGVSPHRVVTLTAPDGVGKSVWLNHMLLQELVPNPEEPSVIWFSAQASHGSAGPYTPLGLWTDLLQKAVPVPPDGVDGDELSKWIQQSVDQVFGDEANETHYRLMESVLYAKSLQEEPRLSMVESQMACADLLARFFEKMAQKMPVVVVMDDVHRADAASMALLTQVWHAIDTAAPVVWVVGWDSAYAPTGQLSSAIQSLSVRKEGVLGGVGIVSGGVDEGAYETLFQQGPFQAMQGALPPDLRQKIFRQSHGSLLYVSEVMTWLHAQGALQMDEASGAIVANPEVNLSALALPKDLGDIYESRLSWLPPEHLDMLAWCATMGERFSLELLSQCCGQDSDSFQNGLQTLAAQQWILTDFQSSGQFRHPSMWAFAYQQLHDVGRRERHKAIATAMDRAGKHMNKALPMGWLAWQFTQSGQWGLARQYWQRVAAAQSALNLPIATTIAWSQCLDALQQEAQQFEAQQPTPGGPLPQSLVQEEMVLKTQLAKVSMASNAELAAKILPDAVAYYQHTANRPALVETLGYLMVAFERIGHVQGALEVLDACLDQLGDDADPMAWVALQSQRACILYQLGQYQATKDLLDEPLIDEILSDARQAELSRLRDKTLQVRSGLTWRLAARQPLEHIQAMLPRVSPNYQAALRLQQAHAQLALGDAEGCENTLQHILPAIRQHEQSGRLLAQWGLVALQRHRAGGNYADAEPLVMPGIQQAHASKDYPTWILLNLEAARLAIHEQRFEDALSVAERMASESSERRLAGCALASWQTMADALMAPESPLRDTVQAQRICQQALDVAQKHNIGFTHMAWQLSMQLAQCHLANGALQDAGNVLQPLWPHIKASGYAPLMGQCAQAISRLYRELAKQQPNPEKRAQQEARSHEFAALASAQPNIRL